MWLGALAALIAGCPAPRERGPRTVTTASGEVPEYPTDFTPPPPLPPPPAADARALGARYLELIYPRFRDGWTAFLEDCRLRLPPQHPLNDPQLAATVKITIDDHGQVIGVTLSAPSGNGDFDEVVRAVATDAGPFPAPDRALLSDDDRLYLTWLFARDQRQAGAATAKLERVEWPLEQAIPKFITDGNVAEAARRVAAAPTGTPAQRGQALSFAERVMHAAIREGLASPDPAVQRLAIEAAGAARISAAARELRSIADGSLDVQLRAAAITALGDLGDVDAAPLLATILERDAGANADLTGAAGRALFRLGGGDRLGQIVVGWFVAGKPAKTQADKARTWAALIAAGQAPVAKAIPDATRLLGAPDPVVRAAACRALGAAVAVDATQAWKGLRKGLADADASVRATCVNAIASAAATGARSRASYWQVSPLLKDRDERVRAAAVLAVVRLEPTRAAAELGAVGRDRSPVVLASLAEAWVRTGAADRTLALLSHESPAVRSAAAGALVNGDDATRAKFAAQPGLEPALRLRALEVTTDRAAIEAASTDPDLAIRTTAAARLIALRGRAETLAGVATQIAAAPSASAERVRLAAAWLQTR